MSYDSPVAMGHPLPPINQCDGCRINAPLVNSPLGLSQLHRYPDGSASGCTKHLYEEKGDGKEV